jgi:hypothetical protein
LFGHLVPGYRTASLFLALTVFLLIDLDFDLTDNLSFLPDFSWDGSVLELIDEFKQVFISHREVMVQDSLLRERGVSETHIIFLEVELQPHFSFIHKGVLKEVVACFLF